MARMSVDDMLGRDPRLMRLAKACGWSRRETAGCLVLDVWPLGYDRESSDLLDADIDTAAGMDGFAQKMVEADLAVRRSTDRIRLRGLRDRIKYLKDKRAAGMRGGRKRVENIRESGQANSKQTPSKLQAPVKQTSSTSGSTPQADGNPSASASASAPVSAPDPVPDLQSAPVGALGHKDVVARFHSLYVQASRGQKPSWGEKQGGMINTLLKKHPAHEIIRRTEILFSAPPKFLIGTTPDLETLVQHFDKLATPYRPPHVNRAQTQLDEQLERIRLLKEQEAAEESEG